MATFSRRNGYNNNGIQFECVSESLKGRIWTSFYKQEFCYYDSFQLDNYTTGIENMMIEMGVPYEFPDNFITRQKNADKLEKFILESNEWYIIYDFIERYLALCNSTKQKKISAEFNRILKDEVSAYRISDKLVVPITNESELIAIQNGMNTEYNAVNTHIAKSLELYADRRHPDYENSIKESISAVESMCSIITGESGKKATLGNTIKKLKENGVRIHAALENAFSSLYGYTSDENGIRHGGIDFSNAPAEDARFMLVTCSAFINYLIEKKCNIDN